MRRFLPKSAWGRALLLAFIYAYGWFVLQCATQWLFWQGHTTVGEYDWGLFTIIPGWILALLWGWPVCSGFSREIIGVRSIAGYIGGLIAVPIGVSLAFYTALACQMYTQVDRIVKGLFYLLSIFGLLVEGRGGFYPAHIAIFTTIFVLGCIGFFVTTRKAKLKGLAGLLVVLCALHAEPVRAYDILTHKTILTNEAAFLLNDKHDKSYEEIFSRRFQIENGTENEDAVAFPRHFYHPTDESGILLFDSARKRLKGEGLLNEAFFNTAIENYKSGDKAVAYEKLGHALHLATQDMFSPPHVHLDIHLEPFSPNGFENWVEQRFSQIVLDPRRAGNLVPPLIAPPEDTLHALARQTYLAARIPGKLQPNPAQPATGTLDEMFPQNHSQKIKFEFDVLANQHVWRISNVGDCFEFTGAVGDPASSDEWWKAKNLTTDPLGADFFYIENSGTAFPAVYKDGSATGGKSLAELWALDKEKLLAKSQEFSAGLMKQFALLVDPIKPGIEIADLSGNPISLGGFTRSHAISVKATDPVDAGHPRVFGNG